MGVTLQIVSANTHKLDGLTEKSFTTSGTIGRAAGNTLVLPDPERFISSQHCAIEDRGDGFYLVDTSINGTYVNNGDKPIGHGNAHRLQEGDRIKIGEFDLVAILQEAVSQSSQWPSQSSQWPSQSSQWPPSSGSAQISGDPLVNESVDPLQLIPGQSTPQIGHSDPFSSPSAAATPEPDFGFGNFTPPKPEIDPSAPSQGADILGGPAAQDLSGAGAAQQDPFAPAPTGGFPEPAAGAGAIPEDWDKTTMPQSLSPQAPVSQAPFSEPPFSEPPGQGNQPPQGQFQQSPFPPSAAMHSPSAQSPAAQPQIPQSPGPADQNPLGLEGGTPAPGWDQAGRQPHQNLAEGAGAGAQPPQPAQPAQPAYGAPGPGAGDQQRQGHQQPATQPPVDAGAGAGPGIENLLQMAGLDQATARALDTPANHQALGQALRLVVRELMEVLHARAEVKNQFRVPMTQIGATENNPLKFCANDLDALRRLLVQEGHGFQGLVEALDEGFGDVKAHQMAMMAGMRAAFDHLFARFDPESLRRGFDQELRRSPLFQPLNKTKYWDMLSEMYADLSRDSDANFSRLFGDEFARAYEEQMNKLDQIRRS
jgi:type VI secretion system protein